jgi:hypothetical protein
MERIKAKYAVMAVALAFTGTGAFAEWAARSANDVSTSAGTRMHASSANRVQGNGEATTAAPNEFAPADSSAMTNYADPDVRSTSPGASAGAPYGDTYGERRDEEVGRGAAADDSSSRYAPDTAGSQPGEEDNHDGERSGQG